MTKVDDFHSDGCVLCSQQKRKDFHTFNSLLQATFSQSQLSPYKDGVLYKIICTGKLSMVCQAMKAKSLS